MSRMKDFVLRDIEGGGSGQFNPPVQTGVPARLYDYTEQLIAYCANTPEAIAKAAMEHPEIRFYVGMPQRTQMRHVSALTPHMSDANKANSQYVPVAGVVPVVDSFDPAELIDN